MLNYLDSGEKVQYTNAGSAILSGDVVVLTNRIAVAECDIAATTGVGVLQLKGEFQLKKKTGEAFAVGDIVFWDATNGLTATATGNTWAGVASSAQVSADVLANVILLPMPKKMPLQADSVASTGTGAATDLNLLLAALKAAGLMANA